MPKLWGIVSVDLTEERWDAFQSIRPNDARIKALAHLLLSSPMYEKHIDHLTVTDDDVDPFAWVERGER